jgi:Flp pilus assembly protein TadD
MTRRPRRRGVAVLAALLAGGCAGTPKRDADVLRRVRLGLVEKMADRGEWAAALRAADALTKEEPDGARARLLRARALRHQGMLAEAESDLRRVLRLDPGDAAAHAELGVVCELAGRPEEALSHHREALRLAPGDPRYLNNVGFALMLRGRGREAVPLLEEALRVEPGSARLRNNLGFAYAAGGELARAARQFELGGTPADAKNNLALAYELNGNLVQAYELYLDAWRLEPAPRIRDNLLHVARKLGRSVPPEVESTEDAGRGGT